jgi:hypothetical protein
MDFREWQMNLAIRYQAQHEEAVREAEKHEREIAVQEREAGEIVGTRCSGRQVIRCHGVDEVSNWLSRRQRSSKSATRLLSCFGSHTKRSRSRKIAKVLRASVHGPQEKHFKGTTK